MLQRASCLIAFGADELCSLAKGVRAKISRERRLACVPRRDHCRSCRCRGGSPVMSPAIAALVVFLNWGELECSSVPTFEVVNPMFFQRRVVCLDESWPRRT